MNKELVSAEQIETFRQALIHPDWYIRLKDYLIKVELPIVHDDPILFARRMVFYKIVEEMLEKGEIPLAQSGPDLDSERQNIDSIVIHHAETDSGIKLDTLSAIGFIRQYAKGYLEDNVWGRKGLRGKSIWSGHFRDGEMVFFAYHWLIRSDGKAERLLKDAEVGHHALDMNPMSIGIAFDGNYEHSTPPLEQIMATAEVINLQYHFVDKSRILGHLETNPDRTCPGDKFLGGWKKILLSGI